MFQLSQEEWSSLRSQFATLKAGRGQHRKYLPQAFTEHGAIMAATILNSSRATELIAVKRHLADQVQASDGFCTQNLPPVISMQVPVMKDA